MELRKDYILDRWALISEGRSKRPEEFKKDASAKPEKQCFFCPGNEKFTPVMSFHINNPDGSWKIRTFRNMFPAVSAYELPEKKDGFFTSMTPFGVHEVIVETDRHDRQLASFSVEEIKDVLKAYVHRTDELSKIKGIEYVDIFKNNGAQGGTSLVHSHSQIIAYNKIPTLVKQEMHAAAHYQDCPFCQIAEIEQKTERFVFQNDSFVVFCPYAPRYNYEAWILPKKHITCITKLSEEDIFFLAEALHKVLSKLSDLNCSYNYYIHTSSKEEKLHFHIEVCPRIATWAGFELSSDEIINSVSPEHAALWYKEVKE